MSMEVDPKFIISRDEALKLVPDLVRLTEKGIGDDWALWEKVNAIEQSVKKGQPVIVVDKNYENPAASTYVRAKISLIKHDLRAPDGLFTRVKAGNLSWRVDGNDHFAPVSR